jgi:SNF2 family DNA or RNA helicase
MELHKYQLKIVDFILSHTNSILAVGMGLGKTISVLHAIEKDNPNTLLIVAPKRVAETVWIQEALKWGLVDIADKMILVAGTPSQRKSALLNESKPYKVIGRDNLKDVVGFSFKWIVIDELTGFKNVDSNRSKYLSTISREKAIGLTGTFIANGAIDVFGQSAAIFTPVNPLGDNFYRWRATMFYDAAPPKVKWKKWKLLKGITIDDVITPIKENIITLDSSDYLNIPELTSEIHYVSLSDEERSNYDMMQSFLMSDLGAVKSEEQKFSKLCTMCNGFVYTKQEDGLRLSARGSKSTKLDLIAEFLERAYSEGEQVLLFYAFIEEAIWLSEKLKDRGIPFCSVSNKRFKELWDNYEAGVLFAHPASAGHGLNLQDGGRLCVWSTLTFDYDLFAQANARLQRQGQRRAVQNHYFICKDTIEERQYSSLLKKDAEFNEFKELTKINI